MILSAGYSLTDAEQRDAVVAVFAAMGARARPYAACRDLSISADSVDPERIHVFDRWRDPPSGAAWRNVANPPKVTLRKTSGKFYRTDRAEKPF